MSVDADGMALALQFGIARRKRPVPAPIKYRSSNTKSANCRQSARAKRVPANRLRGKPSPRSFITSRTPGAVERAQHRANGKADAALARARKADAAGDADGCFKRSPGERSLRPLMRLQ